jgi:hypothetical protein
MKQHYRESYPRYVLSPYVLCRRSEDCDFGRSGFNNEVPKQSPRRVNFMRGQMLLYFVFPGQLSG